MTLKIEDLDSPMMVWISPPGEQIISLERLVLELRRPGGEILLNFSLSPGIYHSIEVNACDRRLGRGVYGR
jgi:hypothetical protein